MKFLFKSSQRAQDLGILILRLGIGTLFIMHGYPKIMGGIEKWTWLGSQLHYFGITFAPVFFGLAASLAEFCGGIALVLGLGTRIAAFFMADVMVVAITMHLKTGDAFTVYSHPMALLTVFISLLIMGAGRYSLDHRLLG